MSICTMGILEGTEKEVEKEGCGREQEMRTRRRDREEASLTRDNQQSNSTEEDGDVRHINRTRSRHKVGEGGSK